MQDCERDLLAIAFDVERDFGSQADPRDDEFQARLRELSRGPIGAMA